MNPTAPGSGEYDPTPMGIPTRAQMRVGKFVCPKCNKECSPREVEEQYPLFGYTCPRCFKHLLEENLPQMKPVNEAVPVESDEQRKSALHPRPDEKKIRTVIIYKDKSKNQRE